MTNNSYNTFVEGSIESGALLGDNTDLLSLWEEQRKWTRIANNARGEITNAQNAVIYFSIIGAACQALSTLLDTYAWAASSFGAICLAIVPVLKVTVLNKEKLNDRIDSRLLAEKLKALVYKVLVGVQDPKELVTNWNDIKHEHINSRLILLLAATSGDEKKIPRVPADQTPKEWYVKKRISREIEYRQEKIEELSKSILKLARTELQLTVAAAIMGAASTIKDAGGTMAEYLQSSIGIWVAVITTASASLSTHIATSKAEAMVGKLSRAKEKLEAEQRRYKLYYSSDTGDDNWAEIVSNCEKALLEQAMEWKHLELKKPNEDDKE